MQQQQQPNMNYQQQQPGMGFNNANMIGNESGMMQQNNNNMMMYGNIGMMGQQYQMQSNGMMPQRNNMMGIPPQVGIFNNNNSIMNSGMIPQSHNSMMTPQSTQNNTDMVNNNGMNRNSAATGAPSQPQVPSHSPNNNQGGTAAAASGSRMIGSRLARPAFVDPATNIMYETDQAEYEGWLTKQSMWLKDWRRRYVILKGNKLFFAKNEYQAPHGMIDLAHCTTVKSADWKSKKRHSFEISTPEITYLLYADTESEKDDWIGR